jgi:hypothetical protein
MQILGKGLSVLFLGVGMEAGSGNVKYLDDLTFH